MESTAPADRPNPVRRVFGEARRLWDSNKASITAGLLLTAGTGAACHHWTPWVAIPAAVAVSVAGVVWRGFILEDRKKNEHDQHGKHTTQDFIAPTIAAAFIGVVAGLFAGLFSSVCYDGYYGVEAPPSIPLKNALNARHTIAEQQFKMGAYDVVRGGLYQFIPTDGQSPAGYYASYTMTKIVPDWVTGKPTPISWTIPGPTQNGTIPPALLPTQRKAAPAPVVGH